MTLGMLLIVLTSMSCSSEKDGGTGSINIAESERTIEIAAESTVATLHFSTNAVWSAKSSESWLTLDPSSGSGGTATVTLHTSSTNSGKEARRATITITCAGTTEEVYVTQQPSTVTVLNESDIQDFDKYYKPQEFSNMNMLRSDAKWSWVRSKQSEHFFVFWEDGFGSNPNSSDVPEELRVDIDDLLQKAEMFYKTNITKLHMATVGEGKSQLDKYKMEIYLLYQTEWLATGSGYDDVIGALWVNPSTCQPVGSTIGHEIGHSFQYQTYCDQILNGSPNDYSTGFRYGYEGSNGGNGFWEQCAQWQSYQDYPEQYFGDGWYSVWPSNCHRHFEHEWMRYASYWLQCYWTEKHGDTTLGNIWQKSKKPYDAIQTYQQLYCNNSWKTCAAELYDYAARMATYDVLGPRPYSAQHLTDYKTTFYTTSDGYYQVAYAQCPGCTGFNIIPLNAVAGKQITADFVGLELGAALAADDPGDYKGKQGDNTEVVIGQTRNYNKIGTTKGWRYGFAAYLSNGTRQYSDMFSADKGTATWTVPSGTQYLYMIVMGCPTTYLQSAWDEDERTDAQFPYKVKFTGTDLKGNYDIDPSQSVKDVTISIDAPCKTNIDSEYLQGTIDLTGYQELAQAFVMQPSEIVSKLKNVGTEPAEGTIVWANLESNGKYSYNSTANNGFWCDKSGNNVGWSDGYAYTEFSGLTISYGQYPKKNAAGDSYTLTPTLIYTKGGKQYKAAIKLKFKF